MGDERVQSSDQPPSGQSNKRPVWRSKLVLFAAAITLIGLVMWVYALATRPLVVPAPQTGVIGDSSGTSEPVRRMIDDSAPATLRFGLSFLVGFFVAFVARKFLRLTLLFSALVVGGIYATRKLGLWSFDAAGVESQVDAGLAAAAETSSQARAWIAGYLPSAAAAGVGGFFGFRRG